MTFEILTYKKFAILRRSPLYSIAIRCLNGLFTKNNRLINLHFRLHTYIDKRHQKYGDIFRERLGGTQDAIFVSSANLMRAVFLHEGSYPRHPLPDAWILYNQHHKCERGLFFM